MKNLIYKIIFGTFILTTIAFPNEVKAQENIEPVSLGFPIVGCTITRYETILSKEDRILLAELVMAESENQSLDTQYAVACVVLNRMKSDLFPDTVEDVIFQDNQFSCVYDNRLNRVSGLANESCIEAVEMACEQNELPEDVLYFTSNGYLKGTEPFDQLEDMYFSLQK